MDLENICDPILKFNTLHYSASILVNIKITFTIKLRYCRVYTPLMSLRFIFTGKLFNMNYNNVEWAVKSW
jgi:hypothetical protein